MELEEPRGRTTLNRRRDYIVPTLALERGAPEPLHRQVARQIGDAILVGVLAPEARLPSTRLLASLLRISRNTVIAAYDELVAAGLVRAATGAGVRVTAGAPLSGVPPTGMRRLIDDAHFPAKVVPVQDSDANPLYIRY
jgi:DNA-binding GntR family transcriptional regulator